MKKYLLPALMLPLMFSCVGGSARDAVQEYGLAEAPAPTALASLHATEVAAAGAVTETGRPRAHNVLFIVLGHTGHGRIR
jgi:hypothetical protein